MATFRFIMGTYKRSPMSVRHEIKSQLAKLLATEDLVVEHKKVETACFNVHTRVLTLPMWERASNSVYDMLVGHEVGHALYTPDEDWSENCKVPKQFVNVVEDARIEKMMKRRYPGIAKTFFNGYRELSDEDFFSLDGEDVSLMNLADRVNLYYKIGSFVNVPFEESEKDIVEMIGKTETFADVLIAAEELYKLCKENKKEKLDDIEMPPQQQGGCNQGAEKEETENSDNSVESEESKPESSDKGDNGGHETSGSTTDEPEVTTDDILQDKIRDLVDMSGIENVYVELPKLNLETVIGKNEEIHELLNQYYSIQQQKQDESFTEYGIPLESIFNNVDSQYLKFKKSSQKEVNYLVKEFECKKAADSYARATTARTGVLDCTKLHTYKYNEDLFKKVTTLADGKNHGLVFVLDWSGSMQYVLEDTLKQLYNLIWFCKKVAIPFEVYAFTNEWRRGAYDYKTHQHLSTDRTSHYEKKEGLAAIDESFSMMNILTSKTSGKDLDQQMLNIWRLALAFGESYTNKYGYPNRMSLSGTPLNEALVSLHQILPKFQKENKVQKIQCIVLTDGEANHLPYHVKIQRHWESEPYIGCRGFNPATCFLRDRKLGTTYRIDHYWHKFTDTLLLNLKENFPSVNFIGIRVLMSRDANRFIQMYYDQYTKEYESVHKDWKKLRSFTIKNSGYDAYFGLSASALSQESEFTVKDDATKSQIKSAFAKSLKTKKLNKKVLGEFISLVA